MSECRAAKRHLGRLVRCSEREQKIWKVWEDANIYRVNLSTHCGKTNSRTHTYTYGVPRHGVSEFGMSWRIPVRRHFNQNQRNVWINNQCHGSGTKSLSTRKVQIWRSKVRESWRISAHLTDCLVLSCFSRELGIKCTKVTPVGGPIFETKNRAIFPQRFFGRGITAREQLSRAKNSLDFK